MSAPDPQPGPTLKPGDRLEGRHVLVTGGASGIGLSTVENVLAQGAAVSLADRDELAFGTLAERLAHHGDRIHFAVCDVAEESSVIDAVEECSAVHGPIDGLVNSAGIVEKAPAVELDLKSWQRVIDVNLTGTFLMCREVGSRMRQAGRGSMVNIASIDAHVADRLELSYNASKAGVLGLTRTFAVELAEVGVRCNSVSPGYVLTEMTKHNSAADPAVIKVLQGGFDRVPMRRAVEPSEIAATIVFLLSDESSGTTGQDFVVDGGLLADAYLVAALQKSAREITEGRQD